MQVASPDEGVSHRPEICSDGQHPLEGVTGRVKQRVHDLPEIHLLVREHQVEEVCCPACQQLPRFGPKRQERDFFVRARTGQRKPHQTDWKEKVPVLV